MTAAVLIALGVAVVLLRRRRQRKLTLSGLVAVKPQFMVEPPARRHGNRKTELL